jgi:hypothetical protein
MINKNTLEPNDVVKTPPQTSLQAHADDQQKHA